MEVGEHEKEVTIEPFENPAKQPVPQENPVPVPVPEREKEKVGV